MPGGDAPWTATPDGLRLSVRLTPNAARESVDGVTADADGIPLLSVRVRARPVDGAANAALLALLARRLRIRRSAVRLVSGDRSRIKIVDIAGEAEALAQHLDEAIAEGMEKGGTRP